MATPHDDHLPREVGALLSIQVGTPKAYSADGATEPFDRPWTTSFFREPVAGPLWLHTTHLEGNAQADTKNHGTPNQAVLVYAAAHYPTWQTELGRPDIACGGFGENFTVESMDETQVCLADRYQIGGAEIAVTDPRFPCEKIDRRWRSPGLRARVGMTGRTGWYCRVLMEGSVQAGVPVVLLERPYPGWTIARINAAVHGHDTDRDEITAVLACPVLDPWWHIWLRKRLGQAVFY